jgi:protocatechuate 3,4-dioxygenase beta subunit
MRDDRGDNGHQDGGFHQDLQLLQNRLIERRKALALLGGGTVLAVAGSTLLFPRRASAAGHCVADAPEIVGPYPADGTNQSQGVTSDILTENGVVRSDIRRSFLTSKTKAKGVKVRLEFEVINTNNGCAAESGFAVYVWHCSREGLYSLYTAPDESYLRGVQVSDDNGKLSFVTIFPGCYPGRWPHIHAEIFTSLDEATNGRNAILTTQLAMPKHICKDVYDNVSGYEKSKFYFGDVSLKTDISFGDDTHKQLAVMTPQFTGNYTDGYQAKATLGVPV